MIAALSRAGIVFGMQQTCVKPPCAAARVPGGERLLVRLPGSRRWT